MIRKTGHRAIVIMVLLAVGATYLQAECTGKEPFTFAADDKARTIASAGYTAVYRIYNDGPSNLEIILKTPKSSSEPIKLKEKRAIDIAKSNDERLLLGSEGVTSGSFQLVWVK